MAHKNASSGRCVLAKLLFVYQSSICYEYFVKSIFYEREYQKFLTCTTDCLTMTDGWSITFTNAFITRSFSRNLTVLDNWIRAILSRHCRAKSCFGKYHSLYFVYVHSLRILDITTPANLMSCIEVVKPKLANQHKSR